MDYNQESDENFVQNYRFLEKNLYKDLISKAFISVGSNLLIDFGDEIDEVLPNGRIYKKSPWCMHLGSGGAWRLIRNNQLLTGSCDSYEEMSNQVKNLVGKKFLSINMTSQFMDLQIAFEGGFQINTFLDAVSEEQWVLLCSNRNTISVECETRTQLKKIQKLSASFDIKNSYQDIFPSINQKKLIEFTLAGTSLCLILDEGLSLNLGACMWRLEKNNEYCTGSTDHIWNADEDRKQYFEEIKGKKLIKSSITHPFQDARFEFENGHVLKTFSCIKDPTPWSILKDNEKNVYSANVSLANN